MQMECPLKGQQRTCWHFRSAALQSVVGPRGGGRFVGVRCSKPTSRRAHPAALDHLAHDAFPKAPHKKRLVINGQKRADLSPAIRPHNYPRSSSYPYRNIVDQRFDPQGCGRFELVQCGPGLNCFPMFTTIRCDQSILFTQGNKRLGRH